MPAPEGNTEKKRRGEQGIRGAGYVCGEHGQTNVMRVKKDHPVSGKVKYLREVASKENRRGAEATKVPENIFSPDAKITLPSKLTKRSARIGERGNLERRVTHHHGRRAGVKQRRPKRGESRSLRRVGPNRQPLSVLEKKGVPQTLHSIELLNAIAQTGSPEHAP